MGDKQKRTQYRTKSDMFGLPDDHRDAPEDYGRPPDVAVAHDLLQLETRVDDRLAVGRHHHRTPQSVTALLVSVE